MDTRIKILIISIVTCLPLLSFGMTKVLYSTADTYYGTAFLTGPNGSETSMHVGGFGDNYYSFVNFDQTQFPKGRIISAKLYIFGTSTNTISPFPRVYRITGLWDEGTLTKALNPVWYSPQFASSTDFSTVSIGWKIFNVTDMYNVWANGSTTYGFTIRAMTNSPNSDTRLSTREDGVYSPRLEVTYQKRPIINNF